MTKKLIVLALIAALVAAFAAAPAGAKKKKKAPKPYTSEEVQIALGHPVAHDASEGNVVSVTAQEFFNSCAIPSSNGVDAYVFEVPADYQKVQATVKVIGEAASGEPAADMDAYMYDSTCAEVGFANAAGEDETGIMVPGTTYVLIHNYTGGPTTAHIELSPYKAPTF